MTQGGWLVVGDLTHHTVWGGGHNASLHSPCAPQGVPASLLLAERVLSGRIASE